MLQKLTNSKSDKETFSGIVQRKFEYFSHQLDLAHKRNDLVYHLRFNILQAFFGFQTLLIGTTVLKGSDVCAIRKQLGGWEILLPLLAFLIGFSLYVIFFRYHIYLYWYKAWIKNLESSLRNLVFSTNDATIGSEYTGTLYLDSNKAVVKLETVGLFTLIAMGILNVGVTFLLLQLFNTTFVMQLSFFVCGSIAHIITVPLMLLFHSTPSLNFPASFKNRKK